MRYLVALLVVEFAVCFVVSDKEHLQHQTHKQHDPVQEEHYKDGEHQDDFDHDAVLGTFNN